MVAEGNSSFLEIVLSLFQWHSQLWDMILISLRISLVSLAIAAFIGLPLGGMLAVKRFPQRPALQRLLNAFCGLPAMMGSLVIYLLLSRLGSYGIFGLLYQPTAIIIALSILITPIIMALSIEHIESEWKRLQPQLRSWRMNAQQALPTLFWRARIALITVILVGFGRTTTDIALVLLVGGSLEFLIPAMSAPVPFIINQSHLPLALVLGLIFLLISLVTIVLARLASPNRIGIFQH